MTGNYRRRSSPRESSPGPDDESGAPVGGNRDGSIREQDRFLPIANVGRIMKRSLPVNAKISKDAKETVQECVSEFISFITGEASEKCHREKRKTVNGDDLLWSMTTLGFVNYVQPLKIYLHRYRELEGEKTTMAKHGDQSPSEDGTLTGAIRTAMDDSNGNRSAISSKCSGSLYSGIPRVCGYDDGTGLWRR